MLVISWNSNKCSFFMIGTFLFPSFSISIVQTLSVFIYVLVSPLLIHLSHLCTLPKTTHCVY